MNYIIDTHILLWSIFDPDKLTHSHRQLIENSNNKIFITSISLWEISLKFGLGKLELNGIKPDDFIEVCNEMNIGIINIDKKFMASYYELPQVKKHKDPFDRLIIWYCINNPYTLLSSDVKFSEYKPFGLITL